jgi:ankyrin repeat protein
MNVENIEQAIRSQDYDFLLKNIDAVAQMPDDPDDNTLLLTILEPLDSDEVPKNKKKFEELVVKLIEKMPHELLDRLDGEDCSALNIACKAANMTIIDALIKAGANLDGSLLFMVGDEDEDCHVDVHRGPETKKQLKVIKYLISKGANVNDGSLVCAAYHGYTNILKELIVAGANVNLQLDGGTTALMFAIDGYLNNDASKVKRVLRMLIDAGADVNIQDANGQTVLMRAALSDMCDSMLTLLDAGANVDIKDNEGHTVFDHYTVDTESVLKSSQEPLKRQMDVKTFKKTLREDKKRMKMWGM